MRAKILTIVVIVFALCLLLWFRPKPNQGIDTVEGNSQTMPTPSTSAAPKPGKHEERAQQSNSPATNLPPAQQTTGVRFVDGIPVNQKLLSEWQAPIDFYGKVVDQDSNAVADAKIQFKWDETPLEDGEKSEATASDVIGLFSLHGARGRVLQVWASKDGYYAPKPGFKNFIYSMTEHFQPDSLNPVVFHLRKKGQGTQLITSQNGVSPSVAVRIPKDNTAVTIDLLQQRASPTGQLEISQMKPPWKDATEWSFQMNIPGGGFVENQDEFQFQAPDGNYQPTLQYDFKKTETNWTMHVTKQFYIEFGEPRKYGWLHIESDLAQETVFLTYAISPSGSQDLEPQ